MPINLGKLGFNGGAVIHMYSFWYLAEVSKSCQWGNRSKEMSEKTAVLMQAGEAKDWGN